MGVAFLIGGRDYVVDDGGAHWLTEHLQQWSAVDETAPESWPAAATVIQRAQLLSEAILEDDGEPLDLGDRDVEVLCSALRDYLVLGNPGLEALYNAARRFRGDPESGFGRGHSGDP